MLKISDAANLAFHALAVLGDERLQLASVNQIALHLGVSEHHLSKVLQRLAKVGLVVSRRGPRGGFALSRPPEDIFLIEIFEAIEGKLPERTCLLERKVCEGTCLMGDLLRSVNSQVAEHLSKTNLAGLNQQTPEGVHGQAQDHRD